MASRKVVTMSRKSYRELVSPLFVLAVGFEALSTTSKGDEAKVAAAVGKTMRGIAGRFHEVLRLRPVEEAYETPKNVKAKSIETWMSKKSASLGRDLGNLREALILRLAEMRNKSNAAELRSECEKLEKVTELLAG